MEKIKIEAQLREKAGVKGELSKIRAQKRIPATVYGAGKEPVSISFSEKDLLAAQKAGNSVIIDIVLPTGAQQAIIKEVQYHVVKDNPIHVDFQRISMDQMLETEVPVLLVGECAYVKTHGAIIDHVTREVTIKCLPSDIPHHIEADISILSMEVHITIGDLVAPKGVTFVDEADRMIVHAIIPRDETPVVAAAVAADAASQPELSATKGKKEEEGAAKK